MSNVSYEAAVFTRTISYKNFKGEERTVELQFALDPLKLLTLIAGFKPKQNKRSGNPAKQGTDMEVTEEQSLKFIQDIAEASAGVPSDDGENWEPFEDFTTSLAGQAFMAKLATSNEDRKEFTEKVVFAPFRAFVAFAKADSDNSAEEVGQLDVMVAQLENVFKTDAPKEMSLEDRRAQLQAELAAMASPVVAPGE